MVDSRGDGRTVGLPSNGPGVSGEFEYGEYGDERGDGELACEAIIAEWSPLVAGDEEGDDRGGRSLRLFGLGGGGRPPTGMRGEGVGTMALAVTRYCRVRFRARA